MIDHDAVTFTTRSMPLRRPALAFGLLLALPGCNSQPESVPDAPMTTLPTRKAAASSKGPTPPTVKFVDVTREAGITFSHFNGAFGDKLLPETMGAGAAFFDYDGDGDQDLLFVNSAPWPGHEINPAPTQRLYRNDGKGRFDDVTKKAGLDRTFYGQGVAIGDYDNDGALDVYITAVGGGHLFRNNGKGRFEDVTEVANARGPNGWLTSAAFLDVENDGDLDLFICNYVTWTPEIDKTQGSELPGVGRAYGPPSAFHGSLCALLRNDGGRFTDVSASSGVQVLTPEQKVPLGKSLGVAPFDLDGDGLVDVAVANDTVQNFLFHNKGGGKFEEIALLAGVAFDQSASPRGGMGCDWAYFLNDERLGLAIGNFANEMTALYVSEEPGSLLFSDVANLYGLGAPTQPPLKFGLFFFDYDLDGRLDLLSANGHLEPEIAKFQATERYAQSAQLLWNSGKRGRDLYIDVGPESAGHDLFRPMVGRGSTYADIDGDGDLDVVLTANNGPARLLRNDGGNANHWVRVRLIGDGKTSNRAAIGAKVTARIGGLVCRRQLFPAKSYLSSVQLPLTFGLGQAQQIDELIIVWPSGETIRLGDLKADQSYDVVQGVGLR